MDKFDELCKVIDTLLGENGCPWDREQTHKSLRPHLLEESYEVADAIDNDDMQSLREELGDLLLHVIFHSRIAEKAGEFNLSDVIKKVTEKLINRHTHIFGLTDPNSSEVKTPEDVEKIWEANKNKEKAITSPLENMQAVPKALPALARAQKVIKRSEKKFEHKELVDTLCQMIGNLDLSESAQKDQLEKSGEILFLLTVLFTKMQINAEFSLTSATLSFINNFRDR